RAIDALNQRIQRLESQPAAPPVAAPAPGAPAPVTAAPAPPAAPTVIDPARPRPPFGPDPQPGPGPLLFDIGIAGDFVGNLTQRNVQKANGGTFAGQENRFFPREVEIGLFGQIDPYASGEVRIEAGEEERAGEITVRLAEATLTLLT